MTWLETLRAKPISWVTTTIVFALFGQLLHDAQHFAHQFQDPARKSVHRTAALRVPSPARGQWRHVTADRRRGAPGISSADARQYPPSRVFHRALARFLFAQAQHLNRRFHHVLQHRHMAPEIEVLEHHGQTRAQQAQLILIRHLQLAVFIAYQINILPRSPQSSLHSGFQGS